MKNIREMTDEQIREIVLLGTSEVVNMDSIVNWVKGGNRSDFKFTIKKEVWNAPKEGEPELLVIRGYLDGYGDHTYIQIWEGDDVSEMEVDFILDGKDHNLSSIVSIVKKLIEWGFV